MKTFRKPLLFFLLALGLGLAGCTLFSRPVAPAVAPPPPTPTPEICSVNPPGLRIDLVFTTRNEGFQNILLQGSGFLPGEILAIYIEGDGDTHGAKIDTTDFAVNADGAFSMSEGLPMDDPLMTWQVHVVHQRGIACLGFNIQR